MSQELLVIAILIAGGFFLILHISQIQPRLSASDITHLEKLCDVDFICSAEVHKKWPGIMLDGDYMLREFIDPLDSRALGMSNKPKSIKEMTEAGAEERFEQLITAIHLHCANMRRMGKVGDGGWDICISGPYQPQKGCIVYSFGIANDFSFDDAMGKTFGCQVKSYDPSMAKGDHRRSENVFFTNLGSVKEI